MSISTALNTAINTINTINTAINTLNRSNTMKPAFLLCRPMFQENFLHSVLEHPQTPAILQIMRQNPDVFISADECEAGDSLQCFGVIGETQYDLFCVKTSFGWWNITLTEISELDTSPFCVTDYAKIVNSLYEQLDPHRPESHYMMIVCDDEEEFNARWNTGKAVHHTHRMQVGYATIVLRILYTSAGPVVMMPRIK